MLREGTCCEEGSVQSIHVLYNVTISLPMPNLRSAAFFKLRAVRSFTGKLWMTKWVVLATYGAEVFAFAPCDTLRLGELLLKELSRLADPSA